MIVTLTIPDALAARLGAEADLPRRALDAYRAGKLSNLELRELLGMESRYEMDGFLPPPSADRSMS